MFFMFFIVRCQGFSLCHVNMAGARVMVGSKKGENQHAEEENS